MKLFITVFTTLLLLVFFHLSQANAAIKLEIPTGDVGIIKVEGNTKKEAYEKAATECFDRRVALYEKYRGPISNERGLDIIDSCVNIQ